MFRKLISILKNKFVIVLLLFVAWIFFFDKNNVIQQIEAKRMLHRYQKEKQFYIQQIKADSEATYDLMSDTAHLQKFAREKYFMKKDSEDVFMMIPKEEKGK
jgi:cell division protein FtsB